MSSRIVRSKSCTIALIVLLLYSWIEVTAENVRYNPVPREAVESRLGKYAGNNKQREATLKQMFADAGCDDQHLSEQPVKGSKLPNVICLLRGSSDRVIIVGAHFDRAPDGDGVVDNWSGASLLPSLYEAVKTEPRKHTYIFIGFTDEEQGEVGSRFYARQMTKEQVVATDADGEHGHAWPSACRGLGQPFGQKVAWCTRLYRETIACTRHRCQCGSSRQQRRGAVLRTQDSPNYDSLTNPGDLGCSHPSHVEGQDFGHAARRLLSNISPARALCCVLGPDCERPCDGECALGRNHC